MTVLCSHLLPPFCADDACLASQDSFPTKVCSCKPTLVAKWIPCTTDWKCYQVNWKKCLWSTESAKAGWCYSWTRGKTIWTYLYYQLICIIFSFSFCIIVWICCSSALSPILTWVLLSASSFVVCRLSLTFWCSVGTLREMVCCSLSLLCLPRSLKPPSLSSR